MQKTEFWLRTGRISSWLQGFRVCVSTLLFSNIQEQKICVRERVEKECFLFETAEREQREEGMCVG